MFRNIGDKLCGVAKFVAWVGVLCCIIGAWCVFWAFFDDFDTIYVGLPALALGVSSIIGSWSLYAFGQVTNDIHAIKKSVCEEDKHFT